MLNVLWRIKHWFKYEPSIFFSGSLAKMFGFFAECTKRFGEFVVGKEKFDRMIKEEKVK